MGSPRGGYNPVNIYALCIRPPEYIKQILTCIKGESDSNIVIVGNFHTVLTSRGISFRQNE